MYESLKSEKRAAEDYKREQQLKPDHDDLIAGSFAYLLPLLASSIVAVVKMKTTRTLPRSSQPRLLLHRKKMTTSILCLHMTEKP